MRPTHILTATIASAALLLTGCGTTEPTDDKTSAAPTATNDPTQEAITGTTEAITGFHKASDEVNANHWDDLSPMDEYTTGEAREYEQDIADLYKPEGKFYTGTTEVTGIETTNVNVDAGSVEAQACVDTSSYQLHESDGSVVEVEQVGPTRAIKTYTVVYDEVKDAWLVKEYDSMGDEKC